MNKKEQQTQQRLQEIKQSYLKALRHFDTHEIIDFNACYFYQMTEKIETFFYGLAYYPHRDTVAFNAYITVSDLDQFTDDYILQTASELYRELVLYRNERELC